MGKASWEIPGPEAATDDAPAGDGDKDVQRRRNSLLAAGAPPKASKNKGGKSKLYRVKQGTASASKPEKAPNTMGSTDNVKVEAQGRLNNKLGEVKKRRDSLVAAGIPPEEKTDVMASTELPEGWKEYYSKEHKRRYFYNKTLSKTSWTIPEAATEDGEADAAGGSGKAGVAPSGESVEAPTITKKKTAKKSMRARRRSTLKKAPPPPPS